MDRQFKVWALTKLDLKDDGHFSAVFATLNVEDAQGDVTIPGAFGEQSVLISQYNHGSWDRGVSALPIGVGKIYEKGEEAIVEGEFDMDDPAAVATYKKMKYIHGKGRVQEFSYALPDIDFEMREQDGHRVRVLKKIRVNEVSPVLMGAGRNTRLLSIKGEDMKPYPNEHACRLKDPGSFDRFRRVNCDRKHDGKCLDVIYGIKDGKAQEQAYRYPKKVWDEAAAKAHCKAHDGSFEAAAKEADDAMVADDAELAGLKLVDHVSILLGENHGLVDRLCKVRELRAQKGGELATETQERAKELRAIMAATLLELDRLSIEPDSVRAEFLRFQRYLAHRRG